MRQQPRPSYALVPYTYDDPITGGGTRLANPYTQPAQGYGFRNSLTICGVVYSVSLDVPPLRPAHRSRPPPTLVSRCTPRVETEACAPSLSTSYPPPPPTAPLPAVPPCSFIPSRQSVVGGIHPFPSPTSPASPPPYFPHHPGAPLHSELRLVCNGRVDHSAAGTGRGFSVRERGACGPSLLSLADAIAHCYWRRRSRSQFRCWRRHRGWCCCQCRTTVGRRPRRPRRPRHPDSSVVAVVIALVVCCRHYRRRLPSSVVRAVVAAASPARGPCRRTPTSSRDTCLYTPARSSVLLPPLSCSFSRSSCCPSSTTPLTCSLRTGAAATSSPDATACIPIGARYGYVRRPEPCRGFPLTPTPHHPTPHHLSRATAFR